MLTPERRNELNRAINAKAIRVAIFDVGCALIALFAADQAAKLWPPYPYLPLWVAGAAFIALVIDRYKDLRSLSFLEGRLDDDETQGGID